MEKINPSTQIAKAPKQSILGPRLKLLTNYFEFEHRNSNAIYHYHVDFIPELPEDAKKPRGRIINLLEEPISKVLGNFLFLSSALYALKNVPVVDSFEVDYDDVKYIVSMRMVKEVNLDDNERLVFYKIAFNRALRKMKFAQIGRKFFDTNAAKRIKLDQQGLQIMNGFSAVLQMSETGVTIKVDIAHRILRTETALHVIKDHRRSTRGQQEYVEKVSRSLVGSTVLTRYNDRTYRINDVLFNRSPYDTFETKDGPVEFIEYYKRVWKIEIIDVTQPLLLILNERTGKTIELIPELCFMTGLTEALRSDFNLKRELDQRMKLNGNERINQCKKLFDAIRETKEADKEFSKWEIRIKKEPLPAEGFTHHAGEILMGWDKSKEKISMSKERISVSIENTPDLDRKLQNPMFEQPLLRTWAIFSERDSPEFQEFVSNIKTSLNNFKMECKMPKIVHVNASDFETWKKALRGTLEGKMVDIVVLVLPSKFKKCELYEPIKRLFVTELGIPSQVVCHDTIKRGRNLLSICHKLIIQLNAKIKSGIPWAVSDMPFTEAPTMIIGIDVYHKTASRKQSHLGFCATLNSTFTKYFSMVKKHDVGQETSNMLEDCTKRALKSFYDYNEKNKIFPKRVIVYRDGVSQGQYKYLLSTELPQIINAFKEMTETVPEVIFILVDKRIDTRLFIKVGSRIDNVDPGTVVDKGITRSSVNEFYMVSQKSKVGTATPTHYTVLYNTFQDSNMREIQQLTYKLCYLYYNWSGGIRVPAPVQNAHRLASLVGAIDKGTGVIPHQKLQDLRSLYYL